MRPTTCPRAIPRSRSGPKRRNRPIGGSAADQGVRPTLRSERVFQLWTAREGGLLLNDGTPGNRKIGSQGLVAGAIGLGCMGMTHAYGVGDEAESIATVHRALDCGVTLLDTAEVYGPHTNEELVGKAIRGRRDRCRAGDEVWFRGRRRD